jgi:hypothetical protein
MSAAKMAANLRLGLVWPSSVDIPALPDHLPNTR